MQKDIEFLVNNREKLDKIIVRLDDLKFKFYIPNRIFGKNGY